MLSEVRIPLLLPRLWQNDDVRVYIKSRCISFPLPSIPSSYRSNGPLLLRLLRMEHHCFRNFIYLAKLPVVAQNPLASPPKATIR
jgi:hypothetical protein